MNAPTRLDRSEIVASLRQSRFTNADDPAQRSKFSITMAKSSPVRR